MLLLEIIDKLFLFYSLLLLVRILGSWIPEWQTTRFMQFIAFYTDPYLDLFRRFIPPLGMVDISPMIAILCLGLIEGVVKTLAANLFI